MVAIHRGFPNEIFCDKHSNKRSTRCLWWIVLNVPHYKFYLYKVAYIYVYISIFTQFMWVQFMVDLHRLILRWSEHFWMTPGNVSSVKDFSFFTYFCHSISYKIWPFYCASGVVDIFTNENGFHRCVLCFSKYTHTIYYTAHIDACCFFFTFINLKLSKLNKR